jgi:hypothetical protein
MDFWHRICYFRGMMSKIVEVAKRKMLVLALAFCCPLILCCILYPSFRYEKAFMGTTEIRYDKFTGVIYLKNSPSAKAEWIPTGYKDIMETKYRLAEKELEETFREIRKAPQQKIRNRVSLNEVRVIPPSPYN